MNTVKDADTLRAIASDIRRQGGMSEAIASTIERIAARVGAHDELLAALVRLRDSVDNRENRSPERSPLFASALAAADKAIANAIRGNS